jgi:FAD/FMN-containing dehydrogenase
MTTDRLPAAVPAQASQDDGLIRPELLALREACGGAVHLPGDDCYDETRRPWNLTVDQRPAAVAYPADADEVAAVVVAARRAGLRVVPQGTGHNAGPLPDLSDAVLLRTAALCDVSIDPLEQRARVGAGALWEDVVGPAADHGLTALHGSSPDVGVAGYSLGGGIGWYARKYGMQTNHLTAIELVTADGRQLRASADQEPELFWALRGGGGNFGVVTALEFELLPLTTAYAGWLVWDWTHAADVLDAWADWTRRAPDAVTTAYRILQLPPIEAIPEPLRGRKIVAIDGAILADDAVARELLAPLRALGPDLDTFTRSATVDLIRLHGDPEGPTPGVSETSMLASLPPEARDAFIAAAGHQSGSSLLVAELRQLGGALGRPDPAAGALPQLHGEFAVFAVAVAPTPELAARGRHDAGRVVGALAPWANARTYLNFAEARTDLRAAFGAEAYARLQAVRAQYDPDDVFVANHRIAVG